ncbi:MAG: RagB/SusD family nutrient uptake outer membrane protein [Parafilimonas sp.]
MMKHIFKFCLSIGMVALVCISCNKQLEIAPRQSIDAATALTTRDAIDASITGIYARLKSARLYGRDLIALPEALADNGFATNKSGRLTGEAQNSQGATFTNTIWITGYAGINQINLTLAAIPTVTGISASDNNSFQGQLYFLRALFYFEMMKVYAYIPGAVVATLDRGGVPIVLKGIASADSALAFKPSGRNPIDEVYAQIVADFTLANSKLLAASSAAGAASNIANKAAAQAMLARVNLYRKNFTEAKRWSDSCIALAGTRITTTSNYISQWRGADNQESLFQIRFATSAENIGVNESLQTSFTTLVVAGDSSKLGGFGDLVPTLTLLTDLGITLVGGNTTTVFSASNPLIASRSTDVRNLLYEKGSNGRGSAKIETTKYLGKSGFINLDNVPVIRISEVYLTRAEALATAGSPVFNLATALADLKFIKSRRYTDYAGSAQETADNAATQPVLYEEIIRQRRLELAFEGQRFFDLKRLGRDLIKFPHYNNVSFTDTRILAPIPQADVDANPNLKQNAGY